MGKTRGSFWQLRARAELERRRRQGSLRRLQHSYQPRGRAAELQECDARQVILSGPAGTGKSRACLEKLRTCAEHYPGFRGLIVRKTRNSLTDTGLVTWERDVLGPEHPLVINGPRRQFRVSYRFPNGSEIVIGGLDNPSRILSAEYDIIYVQQAEEATENDWEILSTRLRNNRMPYQQLLGDCNPAWPTHWLKLRADKGQTLLWETRHEDNPTLWDEGAKAWTPEGREYIEEVLDKLTGARKARLRWGRWIQAEGVVYEGWDPALHLIDRFTIPRDWRRFRVVDFGYTQPFCCQWWAEDPDGRLYRYRELYVTQRLVEDLAQDIVRLSAGERIEATIADHDAEDAATLKRHGVPTTPARKAVKEGIQAVAERLRKAGDGKPRLFLLRGSLVAADPRLLAAKLPLCAEQEIDSYVWAKGAGGELLKEVPVKENDHGMDSMRYMVMHTIKRGWSRGPAR